MIIEFGVKNFRSIKNRQFLSLEAETTEYKTTNFLQVKNYKNLKLLRSAAIYGANASGKSNLIKALNAFHRMVLKSATYQVDDPIEWYEPFKLDPDTSAQAVEFFINFLTKDEIRYQYSFSFLKERILKEELYFYPKNRKAQLFVREYINGEYRIDFGHYFIAKKQIRNILPNQLLLSKGAQDGHPILMKLYRYFRQYLVWNSHSSGQQAVLRGEIEDWMSRSDKKGFRDKLVRLIRLSDTKIQDIQVFDFDEFDFRFKASLDPILSKHFLTHQKYLSMAVHKTFKNGKEHGADMLPLSEESEGTRMLFNLGGQILKILDTGGILIIDELENSLHPKLSRFLVNLFHYNESNPKNAQLILATHETNLLDKSLFRKDQIWLTEKDEQGRTELFSLSDIEGLGYDAPFEKWYLQGKFGGQPMIDEIEFIFGNEQDKTEEG